MAETHTGIMVMQIVYFV